jgi:hypothetical protein
VHFPDSRTITRSATLPEPFPVSAEIARLALALLDRVDTAGGVGLLGLTVSNPTVATRNRCSATERSSARAIGKVTRGSSFRIEPGLVDNAVPDCDAEIRRGRQKTGISGRGRGSRGRKGIPAQMNHSITPRLEVDVASTPRAKEGSAP